MTQEKFSGKSQIRYVFGKHVYFFFLSKLGFFKHILLPNEEMRAKKPLQNKIRKISQKF